jgi:aminopeptidase C
MASSAQARIKEDQTSNSASHKVNFVEELNILYIIVKMHRKLTIKNAQEDEEVWPLCDCSRTTRLHTRGIITYDTCLGKL